MLSLRVSFSENVKNGKASSRNLLEGSKDFSKTFMNRFSDGINVNYKRKGITSTAVCPGFTVTGFHTASGVQEQMDQVPSFMVFPASRIAKEGVEAMFAGKSIFIPTKTYRFLVFALKNLPPFILKFLSNILAPGRFSKD